MKHKAIFFDRDGTLTYFTAEKEAWRDDKISSWSGKPFELDYDKMMSLFHLASEGKKPWYKTLEDERAGDNQGGERHGAEAQRKDRAGPGRGVADGKAQRVGDQTRVKLQIKA